VKEWLWRLADAISRILYPTAHRSDEEAAPVVESLPREETNAAPASFGGPSFRDRLEARTEAARVRALAAGELYDPYATARAKRKVDRRAKSKPLTRHSTRLVLFKGDVMQQVRLKPNGEHDDPEVQLRDFPLFTREDRDEFVGEVLLAFDKLVEKYEASEAAKSARRVARARAKEHGKFALPPST
jgi:hypothetical protein